jgi:hypothetical protein
MADYNELNALHELLDKGLISQEDYDGQKQRILNPSAAPQPAPPSYQAHGGSGFLTGPQAYAGVPHSLPFSMADAGHRAQHRLTRFEPAVVIILHFVTFGLFTFIWFGLKHGQLPVVAQDDPSAGKAIGFMFIPFFNIFYWNFIFWMRLCDRINLQLALRGLPPKAPKGLAQATCICTLIPYVGGLLNFFILMPILAGTLQSAINMLADADRPQYR